MTAASTETVFDPAAHRLAETRWFGDFALGDRFPLPSRTMTDGLFAAFQAASGDNHPIHYDRVYCQARGHSDLLAHGMQVFIQTAAGAGMFPHLTDDSLLGMLGASFRALHPVYLGDTLYSALEITDLKPQNTTGVLTLTATVYNQDGILVMDGEHKYLLRKGPPA
jgi:acyl dehydratase